MSASWQCVCVGGCVCVRVCGSAGIFWRCRSSLGWELVCSAMRMRMAVQGWASPFLDKCSLLRVVLGDCARSLRSSTEAASPGLTSGLRLGMNVIGVMVWTRRHTGPSALKCIQMPVSGWRRACGYATSPFQP